MRSQLRHAEMFFTPWDALMYYSTITQLWRGGSIFNLTRAAYLCKKKKKKKKDNLKKKIK